MPTRCRPALFYETFYNVGTGVQTSIKQLCDEILNLMQSSLQVEYRPYSDEDARRLVQNRIGSTEKAQRDLGFTHQYDLREGLEKLIVWRSTHGSEA